ncbi:MULTISPECIES: hypothetical protein [unclassified Tenacibaculum]|uniref:hypothetical protein n=1 Tax=unclassified Tenacibaculum TaxID=2635139 RepID=UPI001F235CB8|nr:MULTISPECIES: hypothetical protein [unclassified Tenacibaculum]MCF2875065.1 hypothetical protein [Tenacibaculum sp. Cn5-1]MCF2935141.1 hypothetical protein [Tenacibaculum sp. Cn5-34]MCG7511417.1 hypothetical protein [Tenacibaculum sp. Cn5-46]
MKKTVLAIIVLIVSGVFTSCTDLEGKVVPEKVEQELQSTTGDGDTGGSNGGGNDHDPDPEPEDDGSEGN